MARAGILAGLVLFGVVVAAFATIAPVPEPDVVPGMISVPLEIRPLEGLLPQATNLVREERFQRGDTLAGLLARLGVNDEDARTLLRSAAFRRLRPGITVTATVDAAGALRSLDFVAARDVLVLMTRGESGFTVSEQNAQFETRVEMKSGFIRSSLFAAADAAGIPDAIATQVADIFGGEIDFHRDLRQGDRLSVVYESLAYQGVRVRSGRVLAAEFRNQGRTYRAIWYAGNDADGRGSSGYYTPGGQSLRRAFLRSPLEFSRITSGFGMRLHPFLQSWRAHRGVDYAAPVGTRVRAVGDGTIEFVGRQNGYGNVVVLRHAGQYSTLYAHLSGFARALKRGAHVTQGETIGYVGQSGWATGPHLHYEFRIAGQARNPLAVALPQALPVPATEFAAFSRQSQPLVARLDLISSGPVARLE